MMRTFLFALICLTGVSLSGKEWSHVLPAQMYKRLSLPQRAAVDKALGYYEKGGGGRNEKERKFHTSAAMEWERFRVQHGDSMDPGVFAYSLFMQGMSQNRSANRHTAVKTFTEVLDFFPDDVWVAAPALYFRARTHFAIGDHRKGLSDLTHMLKDPDYRGHPLAGHAYNTVADNHWENKRTAEAVASWETVVDRFAESNSRAVSAARERLRDWQMVQGEIPDVLAHYEAAQRKGSDLDRKVNAVRELYKDVTHKFSRDYTRWYFEPVLGKKEGQVAKSRRVQAFRVWFQQQEPLFTEAGRHWEFLMIQFEDVRRNAPGELEELITTVSAALRKSPSDKQYARAEDFVERLVRIGRYESALSLLEFYPDAADRMWARYDIERKRKNYESADRVLGQLMESGQAKVVSRARKARANLYHKQMKKYDEAIKLYYEINEPPGTLWNIADSQRRKGDKKAAQNTLTEIASIFPDEAARAMYSKAEYFRQDGEKKKAVGFYRNVLNHPEWKKTREASKAHDRLEDMGIDTGGAVIHEVH